MHTLENHRSNRIGWLRAAVMGANDGILSVASLIIGIVAAGADTSTILLAGLAGLVAGAMSMAAGEYVSVWSQADTEAADRKMERKELEAQPEHELAELAAIYVERGVSPDLAEQVAVQLTAHDALSAHLRDELGLHEMLAARPFQAAWTSAATFGVGAAVPVVVSVVCPLRGTMAAIVIAGASLIALAFLGGLAATTGGAHVGRGALRVSLWGAVAMAITYFVGVLVGNPVG